MEDMIKMRDVFREAADIIDEMIALDAKEKNGEDVGKESEAALGRFVFKMVELQNLQSVM
jgi:hypothetical protein